MELLGRVEDQPKYDNKDKYDYCCSGHPAEGKAVFPNNKIVKSFCKPIALRIGHIGSQVLSFDAPTCSPDRP
jgi:hypothetical protein